MPAFLIPLIAALGAVWRRAFGGWIDAPRWAKLAVAFVLALPVFAASAPWWACLIAAALMAASWAPGHEWTEFEALLVRYGAAPLGTAALLFTAGGGPHWWLYALAGPAVAAGYRLSIALALGSGLTTSFVDGPVAVAELIAGAVVFGGLAALAAV